ncbi:ATP synthase F1 subunit delta [Aureispira anguillae]|uniref:ATP synthase subunit delta n=1 Tax=Aureispira anguillae TaxID=2864201 RepID=A0A915YLT8_9BACT|nr:ATP synthase F1 subunit delta [Aureispira anguillae]BDS15277.1 ATP synthase F1 subunit delta [Aureispira anguillae]
MSILRIVSRYAKSLFDLAKKEGQLDQVHDDVMNAWEVAKNEEFADFLKSPIIPIDKKKDVIDVVFANSNKNLVQTFHVMMEHKRESYMADFCRTFHLFYNKEKHVSAVRLTTAVELSESTVNDLLDTFKAKGLLEQTVELIKDIEPSIIGGFILEFDGQVYNASLLHQLDQMKKQFSENLYTKNI